ncbi:MAG: AraC family transcriptional regulator, partial [Acidobacteriota bacterium]
MPAVYDPSICVIVQGTKRLRVGDRVMTYDPWNYLISALTLPVEAEIPEATAGKPFLGFVIRFDPVLVGKLLAEIDDLVEWPKDAPRQVISPCPMTG